MTIWKDKVYHVFAFETNFEIKKVRLPNRIAWEIYKVHADGKREYLDAFDTLRESRIWIRGYPTRPIPLRGGRLGDS